ncbi:MAG: murein biosynthesis integral membrane protein MurJ [Desulfobacteraceae bacterium]
MKLEKSLGVGTATLISRVLGFVRDAVIALMFGATVYSDVFFAAFRIPDLLRKSFSDGVMSISFVPVFTGCLCRQGRGEAFAMARSALFLLSFLAGAAVIAGIVFAPVFAGLIAPGFSPDSYEFSLVVLLSRIMMPYVLCITLMALCMGVLNGLGDFTASAAAPIVLNLVLIFFGLVVSPLFTPPILAMGVGVIIGGVLQLAWQFSRVVAMGVNLFERSPLVHPGAVRAGKLLIPAATGASAYHVNLFFATVMASTLGSGGISYIYYADRLVQFPLALFTVSVSTVLLPELSKTVQAHNREEASVLFTRGVILVLVVTIPAMAGLAVLRQPIVSLLFQQGAFGADAVKNTADALLWFASGLWAFAGTRLFVTLFYAHLDTKTPFTAGAAAVGANVVFSLLLVRPMGYQGLALSISLAAMVNFLWLLVSALPKFSLEVWRQLFFSACRALAVSGIMYGIVYSFFFVVSGGGGQGGKLLLLAEVLCSVLLGAAVYAGCFFVMKFPEVKLIKELVTKEK